MRSVHVETATLPCILTISMADSTDNTAAKWLARAFAQSGSDPRDDTPKPQLAPHPFPFMRIAMIGPGIKALNMDSDGPAHIEALIGF